MSFIYKIFFGETDVIDVEITPDPITVKQRYLVHKQINDTDMKTFLYKLKIKKTKTQAYQKYSRISTLNKIVMKNKFNTLKKI